MTNQANIAVDTSIFAQPILSCTKGEAENYVNTIIDISELQKNQFISIFLSKDLEYTLYEDNSIPDKNQLDSIIDKFNLPQTGYDIYRTIEYIKYCAKNHDVTNVNFIESHFDIEVYDVVNPKFTPSVFTKNTSDSLKTSFVNLVILVIILTNPDFVRSPLTNFKLLKKNSTNQIIDVKVQSCEIISDNDDIIMTSLEKNLIDGKVHVCGCISEIFDSFDASLILKNAHKINRVGILEFAIKIALYQQLNLQFHDFISWYNLLELGVNDRFVKNAIEICKRQPRSFSEKVLRSIANIFCGDISDYPHKIGTHHGADKIRIDVDNDSHIHFLKYPNGTIELYEIGTEHDDNLKGRRRG